MKEFIFYIHNNLNKGEDTLFNGRDRLILSLISGKN